MGDREAKPLHPLDHRGRGRGASGHHVHRQRARGDAGRVQQQAHDDRRAAEMGDALAIQRRQDRRGLHPA